MIGDSSYYRRTIYTNWKPWGNNREHTKEEVAMREWPSNQVAKWPSHDHMITVIGGQGLRHVESGLRRGGDR